MDISSDDGDRAPDVLQLSTLPRPRRRHAKHHYLVNVFIDFRTCLAAWIHVARSTRLRFHSNFTSHRELSRNRDEEIVVLLSAAIARDVDGLLNILTPRRFHRAACC